MLKTPALMTATLLAATGPLLSQCSNPWLPNAGWAGVNREVFHAVHWDSDGSGPAPELLVVVGEFWQAGTIAAEGVATWNPTTASWSALPPLPFIPDRALVLPSGELWVTARIGQPGAVDFVRWNGTAWLPEQVPLQSVRTAYTHPNGNLLIGGAGGVRRWNGTSWLALGTLPATVNALATLPNGNIVAGGNFTVAGGAPADGLAVWNGTSWTGLGLGLNGNVNSLHVLANGDLVAGGLFTTAGGQIAKRVAIWDGANWLPMGAGMNDSVHTLAQTPSGDILAGGRFTQAGTANANRVARWDGSTWLPLPANGGADEGIGNTPFDTVNVLSVAANGEAVAGGLFVRAGSVGVSNLANWTGSTWTALGTGGGSGGVFALDAIPNGGGLVACGTCTVLAGETVNYIGRFDGQSWAPLGPLSAADGIPYVMTTSPNGDVFVAGLFENIGGVAASHIARWDGASWSPLGAGLDSGGTANAQIATAMTTMPNGDLVVAGNLTSAGGVPANGIARWNGTSWSTLGSGISGQVYALAAMPNGDLIAGGSFTSVGARVARWGGSAWTSLGGGVAAPFSATVWSLQVLPNGDLVAGGDFTTAGGQPANNIARWDGSAWSPLGGGVGASSSESVFSMAVLGNGDLAVGGQFSAAGSVPCERLARWNGTSWSALGNGAPAGPSAMATLADGDLVIAALNLSGQVWRMTTTCPATVAVGGPGCPSSGGANSLAATRLPWIGSTFLAEGSGLPSPAFVFAVSGLTRLAAGQVPLATLLVEGMPGCDLLVSPDFVATTWTTTGSVTTGLAIPADIALVGASLDHQLIPFELDAQLAITSVTASNSLQVVIGQF